jgi:SAM-dependent methyltransferase
MFWFDKTNNDVVFHDNRREVHLLQDSSSKGGFRELVIDPDILGDFTALKFPDNTFTLVVFDPPHLIGNGKTGWLAKKYGKLGANWRTDISKGFSECFRVLKPCGTLIFKWNEQDIPVSEILRLTNEKPLFGNKGGKSGKTHWLVWMKPEEQK